MQTHIKLLLGLLAFLSLLSVPQPAAAYYDPGVQRWINRDPIQEEGGPNLYVAFANAPEDREDAFGLLPPSAPACKALKRKIENIEKDIKKRVGQMDEDPQGLPETDPDDQDHPSKSRRGHRRLINELKRRLAQLKGAYDATCSDPEPDCPQFNEKEWEKVRDAYRRNPGVPPILPGMLPVRVPVWIPLH